MTVFDPELLADMDTEATTSILENPEQLWGDFNPGFEID